VSIVTEDADAIRRQMAQIRRDLHEDVRGVVASAEAVTDWRRYIRNYPIVSLGLAAAVGYLVVPRRHRSVPTDLATHADMTRVREAVEEAGAKPKRADKERKESKERKGLLAMALALVGPVAVRAAQGYAVQAFENWIVQQQQAMAEGPPPPGQGQAKAPGGTGRPSGTPGGRPDLS